MNRPEVHDVLRRWRELVRRRDERGAPRRDVRARPRRRSLRFYGDDLDELHLAFNFVFLHADFEPAQLRADRRRDRGAAARARVAGVDAGQPRHGPLPDALGARRPAALARCALMLLLTLRGTPVLYYGDELGAARRRDRARPHRRSGRPAQRPRVSGPRRRAHADAVDATSRARASRRPAPSRGCRFGDARRGQRRRPARRSRLAAEPDPRPRRAAARRGRICARAPTPRSRVEDGLWAYRRGDGFLVALNLGADAASLPGRRHDRDRHPPRSATARRSRGRCCWRPARARSCAWR